ncbi:hypothetical protein SAMN05660860_02497 [Geoalkalibacter ferrihydriticus]|uniref:DUF2383 domain-containing protein n=2 Tax=Geoalkalibacter ferrihydriticus TaxID=392333 RepID=A0A0C2HMJ6_9BACT|nr:hypothetical protein [Geoalkalibacter ferrihydriticus]KIH76140.1 hypothetical protein GFER_13025 [Geoalkalibacter ferrihydriticus DSM 17813]SDM43191.1 hypothetical protein SAMN05660860_02497 [Geoalkalibacter ferrihydriticus]
MRFEQTSDVLNHVGLFHQQAGEVFRKLSERASNPRVRMLLDYIVRHEESLANSVFSYKTECSPQLLSTWFKYTHDQDIFAPLTAVDLDRDPSFDDVLDLAVDNDAKLLELYQEMVERSTSPDVKELFSSLLLKEMKEKQKLIRSALGLLDI